MVLCHISLLIIAFLILFLISDNFLSMKARNILFLFGILVGLSVSGQTYKTGFVITHAGDTVPGEIAVKPFAQLTYSCQFRPANDSTPVQLTPADIVLFQIADNFHFRSKKPDTSTNRVFAQLLLDGIADLYHIHYGDSTLFYLEKDGQFQPLKNETIHIKINDRLFERENEAYKRVLNYYFQDSPEIMSKVESSKLAEKNLVSLFTDYHEATCDDYSCIDYTKNTKNKIQWEAGVGFGLAQLGLKSSSQHDYSYSPYLGFQVLSAPVGLYEKWNIYSGLSVQNYSFKKVYHHDLLKVKTHRISFEHTAVQLPVGMRRYLGANNRWYAELDLSVYYLMKIRKYRAVSLKYHDIEEKTIETDVYSRTRDVQIGLSTGVGYALGNRISARINYSFAFFIYKSGYLLDYLRPNQLRFGLNYRL